MFYGFISTIITAQFYLSAILSIYQHPTF